jgi:flavin reductase (DIM6/NTAB) family NADH-FMN oxidoreductase RutF/DNA-binding MarR family transcriptional regulator
MNKFETSEFRQALGTFATGVAVITATTENGEPAGVTANSFTSVSLDPPLILWCLASASDSLKIFKDATHFAVNILASDQKNMSTHFAKRMENKFAKIPFVAGLGGAPLLDNCMTQLQCSSKEKYEVGDHWVFVGEVEKFESTSKEALLFHLGSYGISLPLPTDESSLIGSINKPETNDDSLFSLLLQAIHAYQEKFESKQRQLFESNYEARIITILHKYNELDINDICQMIQMPKTDTSTVLNALKDKGLVTYNTATQKHNVKMTEEGLEKAEELITFAKQHDRDVYALFGQCDADAFRDNLMRIIHWENNR